MAKYRLNAANRRDIMKDVLAYRFEPDVRRLQAERRELASETYHDVLGENLKLANSLPDGWLRESNHISVQFGMGFDGFAHLNFSGEISASKRVTPNITDQYVILRLLGDQEERFHRVPSSLSHCAKRYSEGDVLTLRYQAQQEALKLLDAAVGKAVAELNSALARYTTVDQLVEAWPEIRPFAEKHTTRVVETALPALPTDQLNKLLGLPVDEAA